MGYTLTLISALIYFLSFPPFSNGYSAFFALIPFFFTLSKTDSAIKAAACGAIWGITLSILFSIPLYNALITEYKFSVIFSSLLIIMSIYIPYGIIYGMFGFSLRYFKNDAGLFFPLLASSLWLIIDYIMSITPVFMPWGYAGYTQIFNIFIQISDLTGIYGVSFLIVFTNSLITEIPMHNKKYAYQSILIINLLLISTGIYGLLKIQYIENTIHESSEKEIRASVIQGNFSSKEKWDSRNTSAILNTYINLTKQVINGTNITVWPETVLNSSDANNLDVLSGVSTLLKNDQLIIAGATRNDQSKQIFNSILTTGYHGLNHIYDKRILFPFTETSFAGLSSGKFLDSPPVFNEGKTSPIYQTDFAIFGYTICFEAIYPEYVRKLKKLNTSILINVANDSWFGNTYEPYMHLYSCVSRAVENRFYVIRSSNSGISAIISPSGKILDSIDLNTRGQITNTFKISNIPSFYSNTGDWIILVSLLVVIFSIIHQLKNKV